MLAAEILIVYLRVRWLMRRQDIRSVVSTVRVSSPRRPVGVETSSLEDRLVAVRLGVAVRRTLSVLPTDSRCLVQSLVLSRLLSARAISSTLVVGARPEPRFDAHAWVEHEGLPVLPPQGFDELRLVEM
ncbi:MAG: lasso peptide biosynthesis B2 protein [Solirubrobacteraceae bacterium]